MSTINKHQRADFSHVRPIESLAVQVIVLVCRLAWGPKQQPSYVDLPKPRSPRFESLDIWRGIACLMVVTFHSAGYFVQFKLDSAGLIDDVSKKILLGFRFGVPLFFVISGYCIAATADSTRRRRHAIKDFVVRRLRRIAPPYWCALVIQSILLFAVGLLGWGDIMVDEYSQFTSPTDLAPSQWFGNLTLTESWRYQVFGDDRNYYLHPAWSLCYEEQFYAIVGVLVVIAPARIFRGFATISLVTIVLSLLPATGIVESFNGFFFDGRWLLFAAGTLVYYHINYASAREQRWIRWLFPIVSLALLVVRFVAVDRLGIGYKFYGIWTELCAGAAFGCVLLTTHRFDLKFTKSKLLTPIRFCGTICYSLYLVHWPLVKVMSGVSHEIGLHGLRWTLFFTIPVSVLVSVLAAWCFHQLVEKHCLNPPSAALSQPLMSSYGRNTVAQ